jgi:hypothetical protein
MAWPALRMKLYMEHASSLVESKRDCTPFALLVEFVAAMAEILKKD